MALTGDRTYVGFGFGAIQSGLFLYEAYRSGNFDRLVVAEVIPDVVTKVQNHGGTATINIAHKDHVENAQIDGLEIRNPNDNDDRIDLIDAIAEAEEIGTAVPSVDFYASDSPGSIHRLLAEGIRKKMKDDGPRAIIYTAENNNHAAEMLESKVFSLIENHEQENLRSKVQFLNTVIGKMSQVITTSSDIKNRGLSTITPNLMRAFLVESFNEILISKIKLGEEFYRGIQIFKEEDDLFPYEEAKLFGHNATHALIGYLGLVKGVKFIADVKDFPGIIRFARDAFFEESGKSLITKYKGAGDLFSEEGFSFYVDNLIERMMNPFLLDSIVRVTRDVERKLDWNDRLIGTMRLCFSQGIDPRRFAFSTCAALLSMGDTAFDDFPAKLEKMKSRWEITSTSLQDIEMVIDRINSSINDFTKWKDAGSIDPNFIL